LECKHVWFDNDVRKTCPICGSRKSATIFDEDCDDVDTPEFDRYDFEEEEEDDE
jgi:hypothetical protein